MRRLKDRDFIRTEEGFLFCVVGYSHPRDRVISYLKYVPSVGGEWGKGDERYARTMPDYTIPSLLSNIEMLRKEYPRYVFKSRVFNIAMSAVPNDCIVERYLPEVKLGALLDSEKLDSLQETAVKFVTFLSEESGVPREDFGVTGSILTDIHNPEFSDIDLIVYGGGNAWELRKLLKETSAGTAMRKSLELSRERTIKHWMRAYPLNQDDAEEIYRRRWNYGSFNGKFFSLHAVRKDWEIDEKYGEQRFFPMGIIEGEAKVVRVDESVFLPCYYGIQDFNSAYKLDGEVVQVVSFDGLYSGLYARGEKISVKGKLEKVVDKKGALLFRIVVGSPEASGHDYIKSC